MNFSGFSALLVGGLFLFLIYHGELCLAVPVLFVIYMLSKMGTL
jgi:hypothetical protein